MDPKTRELLSCALLNLDKRIVDKKTVINSLLVELSLFRLRYPSSQEQIIIEINNFIGINNFFTNREFESAISECLSRKTIKHNESNSNYSLDDHRKNELEKTITKTKELETDICNNIILYIEHELVNPIDENLGKRICEIILEIFTKKVYESSLLIVREKITIEEVINNIDENEPIKRIEELLSQFSDTSNYLVKAKIIKAISKYINDFPTNLEKFLKIILYNIFINQILNLDPSLVRLQMQWLNRRRLYLDTNVLLSLFCESHVMNKVVQEVINASKLLKIQLFISPVTKAEIVNQIELAKRGIKNIKGNSLLEFVAKHGENAILSTFYEKKHKEPALNWEAFISSFEKIDDLLLDNNILIEDSHFEAAKSASNYEEIRQVISDKKPPFITENVLNHDAINCLIIGYLQQEYKSDERGQTVWLLTLDRTLKRSQKVLLSSKKIDFPYCLQISEWGEIVLPLISLIEIGYDNFLGYLTKAKFGIFPERDIIQLNCFETIINAELPIETLLDLPPHHTQQAMKAIQESKEISNIIDSSRGKKIESEQKEINLKFSNEIQRIIVDTDPNKERIMELEKNVELLLKKLENADNKIEILENHLVNKIITFIKKILNFS